MANNAGMLDVDRVSTGGVVGGVLRLVPMCWLHIGRNQRCNTEWEGSRRDTSVLILHRSLQVRVRFLHFNAVDLLHLHHQSLCHAHTGY